MPKLAKIFWSSRSHWFIIILLAMYQAVRLIVFVNTYGGVEHDSGWFLGLARSLAERGSYTTMVSTIVNPEPGGHENIYGQYNVQDEEGRIYFFTESGVYAAGIIPNAIIIKLFGAGFWQYRAGPLLFFFVGLLLASYLLYKVGGLLSVLIFQLFLFLYPHLIVIFGYEALGEIFGFTYILLTFFFFVSAVRVSRYRVLWFLACGLSAGLAVTTKPITLLSLAGIIPIWLYLFWQKRTYLKEGMAILGGWLSVPLLWEVTQFVTLTSIFDLATYQKHFAQRVDFFFNEGGSGIGTAGSYDLSVFFYKLLMLREISLANDLVSAIVLIVVLAGGPLLIWYYRHDEFRRNIVSLLWGAWFVHTLWFVNLARNPWIRHNWYALMWAVFLLSLLVAVAWHQVKPPLKWSQFVAPVILSGILLPGFMAQSEAVSLFISDKLVDRWHTEHLASEHNRHIRLVPRRDQQMAVEFMAELPPTARIFYIEGHKSAEMAVLTGRILYPLERRPLMPPAENDVILVGPSLISPWAKLMSKPMTKEEQQGLVNTVIQRVKQECPHTLFENNYYLLCAVD